MTQKKERTALSRYKPCVSKTTVWKNNITGTEYPTRDEAYNSVAILPSADVDTYLLQRYYAKKNKQ